MTFTYKNWNSFSPYFSADYARGYLKKCYRRLKIENFEQKSFENCYSFMYYLEHGKIYYQQAAASPIHIKPILLFYGLVHLIKACILSANPDYPETTSVLSHGVSTRKRKKQQYSFLDDEVKFQKNGLFTLMAEKLFHMKQLEGEKVKMGEILAFIPELSPLFSELRGGPSFVKVFNEAGNYYLPESVLDTYHMTENRFMDFYRGKSAVPVTFKESAMNNRSIVFQLDLAGSIEPTPLKFNLEDRQYSFPISRGPMFKFPELLLHYLLLYNLGMIARYEIDWWSELIKMMPNEDYPYIESFLDTTQHKGPYLVYQYLSK